MTHPEQDFMPVPPDLLDEPSVLAIPFSEVAIKEDGSFVVTVAGNRCHVTLEYNESLYSAVRDYLSSGGSSTIYAEDIVVESDPQMLARLWIDERLQTSESIVSQYRDARDLEQELPITSQQFAELLAWRQAVRAWPQTVNYPAQATRPVAPGWIDTVAQHGE